MKTGKLWKLTKFNYCTMNKCPNVCIEFATIDSNYVYSLDLYYIESMHAYHGCDF